jgi:hypothetical protein
LATGFPSGRLSIIASAGLATGHRVPSAHAIVPSTKLDEQGVDRV